MLKSLPMTSLVWCRPIAMELKLRYYTINKLLIIKAKDILYLALKTFPEDSIYFENHSMFVGELVNCDETSKLSKTPFTILPFTYI